MIPMLPSPATRSALLHWAFQILPPMLLLLTFNRHGPGFWFMLTVPGISAVISLVLLPFKLLQLKQQRRYLLRPTLTILIAAALFWIAIWSHSVAERQFESTANTIDTLCKAQKECPTSLPGWQKIGEESYKSTMGTFVTYPVYYRPRGSCGFSLTLYQSLDMERHYSTVREDCPQAEDSSGTSPSPSTANAKSTACP